MPCGTAKQLQSTNIHINSHSKLNFFHLALDPAILETFRKNWEYYEKNPKEKDNLRIISPAKYERLMMYYKSYSHLLPPPAILADRPSSRASIGSGRSSVQVSFDLNWELSHVQGYKRGLHWDLKSRLHHTVVIWNLTIQNPVFLKIGF